MTTLNATLSRRAMDRLTAVPTDEGACAVTPARYTWLRFALPVPAVVDSRTERPVLSTSLSTEIPRVLDVAALVAAAIAFVTLLSLVCR